MRTRALAASVTLLLVSTACRDATQVTFEITTDVPCGRIKGTSVAVGTLADVDTRPFSSVSTRCDGAGHLGSVVVTRGGSEQFAVRVVTGLDGESPDDCARDGYTGGCIVSRRALGFIDHTPLVAEVSMAAACRGIACPDGTTCTAGVCTSWTGSCAGTSCTLPAPTPPSRWAPMRPGSAAGVAGRTHFGSVWTGKELVVFGGTNAGGLAGDGGRYDPVADTWALIPAGPLTPRETFAMVWTGAEVIVWGGVDSVSGSVSDGARFDPARGVWTKMAPAPASVFALGRDAMGAVWAPTTREMIVWGGGSEEPNVQTFADGAAYDPKTDSWRVLAKSPLEARRSPVAIWAGDRALFYVGAASAEDGAFYDPASDTWALFGTSLPSRAPVVAAWSGDPTDPFAIWGGEDAASVYHSDGATVDLASRQSALFGAPPVPAPLRRDGGGWMSNHALWFWGGAGADGAALGDGASFDLAARRWTTLPTAGAPAARSGHAVAWTGNAAIVWGGQDGAGKVLDDGALFTR